MEVRRVEGSDLVKNCVYNIYQKDTEDNYYDSGVYLVLSENERNNPEIRLKGLNRGRYTWRTTKSTIYGTIPIMLTSTDLTNAKLISANLTDAILNMSNLTNANLTDAILTNAKLTCANLTNAILTRANLNNAPLVNANLNGATLIGVNLNGANLNGANLHSANLHSANLTNAILNMSNLNGATLIGVNLNGADLTDADLTDADLTGATIFRDSLSAEQRRQIIGEPNYIQRAQRIQAQGYLNISKELSNGNRISIKTGNKLDNSNFTTQHRISFTRLLDFLLEEENQRKIARSFKIGGEKGIDMGGITLIIFQKCYEAFMERYFYPYEEDNSNYVVLKYLTDEEFEEFKKACAFMISLAKKVKNQLEQPFQILIPINFLLLKVLKFEGNPETFFKLGNKNKFFGKIENGSYSNQHKLNNPFNYIAKNRINNNKNTFSIQRIQEEKYYNNYNNQNNNNQNNNNNKQSTIAQPDTNQKSKKFNAFSEDEQKKLMFLMLLKQNHISKRKQYETMKKFIDEIFKPNKDMFTTSIDYSYDAFVKRLKFKLSGESRNRNLESFESLEIASNPLIQLLLEYIKVSDEYRMVMTAYVCGSYCYTGDIKISIFENPSKFPFQSHTCSKELWVYVNPNNPESFNWLKNKPTNSDYSIEGLYNVFLDRTTQTY